MDALGGIFDRRKPAYLSIHHRAVEGEFDALVRFPRRKGGDTSRNSGSGNGGRVTDRERLVRDPPGKGGEVQILELRGLQADSSCESERRAIMFFPR
jgi:hypothetical protein